MPSGVREEWLAPPATPFTLGPGDRLELEVLGEPDTRTTTVVGPDGRIYFYLLPGLDVWGLTLGQTQELLQRELGRLQPNAAVGITLRDIGSKRFWVLGQVPKPGVYNLPTPTTLLEAISMAGGVNVTIDSTGHQNLADLSRSFVLRDGAFVRVDFEKLLGGDMSQNIYLQPDDFVYLPPLASDEVYVIGAVRTPRALRLGFARTLLAAITACGGPRPDAYQTQVAIVRGSLSEPRVALVNFKDIATGAATDVVLQPGDIVHVPLSPYRLLFRYVDLILTTFVRAIAINEGARAVSDDPTPVSVNIGVGGTGNVPPVNIPTLP